MILSAAFQKQLDAFHTFLDKLNTGSVDQYDMLSRSALLSQFQQFHGEMATAIQFSPEIYESARIAYRERVNPILMEANIIRRNVEIPRGYHGDYETMEMMYRNAFEGATERGRLLHKMVVEGRECESVRERKRYLTSRISSMIEKCEDRVSICSIAAGPASELRDIPPRMLDKVSTVILIDQDEEALKHAYALLPEKLKGVCECVTATVADIVFRKIDVCNIAAYDYVYSAGLFDYLDDVTCKAVIRRGIEMLRPNGTLEVGNFSIWPAACFADMSCGWKLILRNEREMSGLICDGAFAKTTMIADQAFLSVRR